MQQSTLHMSTTPLAREAFGQWEHAAVANLVTTRSILIFGKWKVWELDVPGKSYGSHAKAEWSGRLVV